jgi:hypothetical protein
LNRYSLVDRYYFAVFCLYVPTTPWSPEQETREWHGALTQKDCKRVEKALKDKGLEVDLVDMEATGNPQMPWACIFEGKDADPNAARFPDERSENRDESEYP